MRYEPLDVCGASKQQKIEDTEKKRVKDDQEDAQKFRKEIRHKITELKEERADDIRRWRIDSCWAKAGVIIAVLALTISIISLFHRLF
jgi:hypothetical protein